MYFIQISLLYFSQIKDIGINFQYFTRTFPFVSKRHFLNINSKSYALDKNLVDVFLERQLKFGIRIQY